MTNNRHEPPPATAADTATAAPQPADKTMAFNFVFASNVEQLNWRQWLAVGVVMATLVFFAPAAWNRLEHFSAPDDYRIPAVLGNDYWHYRSWTARAVSEHPVLMIGDSVVWGEYVVPGETLTAYLNRDLGQIVFANAGIGGGHPAALLGLVRHYGGAIRHTKVVLHWNPLWMSGPATDLRRSAADGDDEDAAAAPRINHPALIPQFDWRITGYDADLEQRLSVAIGHHVPLLQLSSHLRTVYFEGLDLPRWSLENPTANPFARITRHLPDMRNEPGSRPAPWAERGLQPQDYQWVPPEESVQWRAFQQLVAILRSRGNDVIVMIGPINRHMMTPRARQDYESLEVFCRTWLEEQGVPHVAPELLPSELYCDASHPLAAGYARQAQELLRHPDFLAWIGPLKP